MIACRGNLTAMCKTPQCNRGPGAGYISIGLRWDKCICIAHVEF